MTQAMGESQRDIWMDMFDEDPGEALSKIASIYQNKGRAYFFDKPHNQKPVYASPIQFIPHMIYAQPFSFQNWLTYRHCYVQ